MVSRLVGRKGGEHEWRDGGGRFEDFGGRLSNLFMATPITYTIVTRGQRAAIYLFVPSLEKLHSERKRGLIAT